MFQKRPLLIAIKNLVNPVVTSLILVGCVWFYLGQFEKGYFVLLMLSFLLVVQIIDGVDFESNNIFWRKTAASLVFQWFFVISLLLLIGFASKLTDYFSRQVLFSWFLITPCVLLMAHRLLRLLLDRYSFTEGEETKAVIVGLNDLSRTLSNEFMQSPILGVTCMGFFDDRMSERLPGTNQQPPETLLGDIASVAEFVKTHSDTA